MSYKNTVKDYSQMIGYITRDKTSRAPSAMDQEPLTMDQGRRIPFAEAPGSVKTKVEGLSKKEKIAQGLEKGRVSTKIDVYTDAVNEFDDMVAEAFTKQDASKLPKNLQRFLMEKGLNDSTYYNLRSFDAVPRATSRDAATLRRSLAVEIISKANEQPKFYTLNDILKDANFSDNEYKLIANDKRVLKLDKAEDKIIKAYDSIFKDANAGQKNVTEFFNPRDKISQITGLDGGTISKKFNVQKHDPENYDLYKKLSNNKVQTAVNNNPERIFTLDQIKDLNKTNPLGSQAKAAATRKGRLDKAKILAGEGVADINTAQKDVVKLLNDHYKKNPDELLGNTKLRNLLDLTLENGEIVKKNKYVTDDDFRKLIQDKKGLFTMDHVDEVQFEKLSTEFPIFKQLATYNTNSGLIKSMKSYMSKNQNSKDPAVQNKIKKQVEFLEDLKLRVDTPTGRVGSKEVLAAVDRKAGILPNFLAQLRALNITLPKKAKVALGAIGGLSATTLATAEEVSQTPFPGMKPQGSPGQLNPETEEGFTTGQKVAGTAAAGVGAYKFGKPLAKKALKFAAGAFGPTGIALSYPALGMIGEEYKTDLSRPLDRGVLGVELAGAKSLVKGTEAATKGISNNAIRSGIQRALNLGMTPAMAMRVARYASPLGIASLAGEGFYQVGKLGYEDQQRFNALSPEEQAAERAEQEKFAFDVEGS